MNRGAGVEPAILRPKLNAMPIWLTSSNRRGHRAPLKGAQLSYYDPHQYMKIKRYNHTTSTKCQYHAAASKPK